MQIKVSYTAFLIASLQQAWGLDKTNASQCKSNVGETQERPCDCLKTVKLTLVPDIRMSDSLVWGLGMLVSRGHMLLLHHSRINRSGRGEKHLGFEGLCGLNSDSTLQAAAAATE